MVNGSNQKNPTTETERSTYHLQRVPALRAFWDLEKTVLHEIGVSGTVLWSPTNAKFPTCMYLHEQKICFLGPTKRETP